MSPKAPPGERAIEGGAPRGRRLALEPPNTPPSNKSSLMRLVPILLFVVAVVPRLYLWWARNYYGLNQTPPGTLTPLDDST